MQITITKQALQEGLKAVVPAVSSRATLPVLSNIFIEASAESLLLAATNLESGIHKLVKCQSAEHGSICVPAKLLVDIIATMPGADLSLSTDDKRVTLIIEGSGSRTEIRGLPSEEFPPQPKMNASGMPVSENTLRRLISQTEFSASRDEARPVLQGVMLSADNQKLTFASTDGFRVSVASAPYKQAMSAVLVPAEALRNVAKLIAGDTFLRFEYGRVLFTGPDWMLFSQVIDGNFPDYKVILPKSFKTTVKASRPDLVMAVRRAALLADSKPVHVSVHGETNALEISATSEDFGETRSESTCEVTGPDIDVAFNSEFLKQVLGVLTNSVVELAMNDRLNPVRISIPGEADQYQYVAMPMQA